MAVRFEKLDIINYLFIIYKYNREAIIGVIRMADDNDQYEIVTYLNKFL